MSVEDYIDELEQYWNDIEVTFENAVKLLIEYRSSLSNGVLKRKSKKAFIICTVLWALKKCQNGGSVRYLDLQNELDKLSDIDSKEVYDIELKKFPKKMKMFRVIRDEALLWDKMNEDIFKNDQKIKESVDECIKEHISIGWMLDEIIELKSAIDFKVSPYGRYNYQIDGIIKNGKDLKSFKYENIQRRPETKYMYLKRKFNTKK